jgi:hypothetical protein
LQNNIRRARLRQLQRQQQQQQPEQEMVSWDSVSSLLLWVYECMSSQTKLVWIHIKPVSCHHDLFIGLTFTILDISHCPVFCLKHDVLESGFCASLQVEPTWLGPICKVVL